MLVSSSIFVYMPIMFLDIFFIVFVILLIPCCTRIGIVKYHVVIATISLRAIMSMASFPDYFILKLIFPKIWSSITLT